jgi:hypothetical protein
MGEETTITSQVPAIDEHAVIDDHTGDLKAAQLSENKVMDLLGRE